MHLSSSARWTISRTNPNVNCWLWVMIYHCWIIICNNCDNQYTIVLIMGSIWELSLLTTQFFCKSKTILKKFLWKTITITPKHAHLLFLLRLLGYGDCFKKTKQQFGLFQKAGISHYKCAQSINSLNNFRALIWAKKLLGMHTF